MTDDSSTHDLHRDPATPDGGSHTAAELAPDKRESDNRVRVPIPETRVPDGEPPAARCPYCDRPFRSERQRDLHLGHAHGAVLTDDQRAAYDGAVDAESEELWVFHMKVVVALGLIYAAFVLSYTVLASA